MDAGSNRDRMVYVARVRRRQTVAQTTHVLAACARVGVGVWQLKRKPGGDGWNFLTLWKLAKTILTQGWPEVHIYSLKWASTAGGALHVVGNAVARWEVWPTVYKRPPNDASDEGPELGDDKKPEQAEERWDCCAWTSCWPCRVA